MYWKRLIFGKTIDKISKINGRLQFKSLYVYENSFVMSAPISTSSTFRSPNTYASKPSPKPIALFGRGIHSTRFTKLSSAGDGSMLESDAMDEFLSRFVWIMRGKLSDFYSDCNKQTIDGMLLIIVDKVVSELANGGVEQMLGHGTATSSVSQELSDDLWKTVWEVSNMVLDDMKKARKKEKMKRFLQCEEVNEMARFAGEIGIRGDMLREMRFKWAREKMEEREFYERLERLREKAKAREKAEAGEAEVEEGIVVSLPKRRGKIKYNVYGLDLSSPKWGEVADKLNEAGEIIWPEEPKPISGKSKLVTEKILALNEKDDPSPLLAEWAELLQPSRTDWTLFLDTLKEKNPGLYFKVAELLLSEKSFQTGIRDYSKLIEAHAKENRLEDAERILKKMKEDGVVPDILTCTILVHMYGKAGNLDRAKETFESLMMHGFQLDFKIYNSMIMAFVNAGQPKLAMSYLREMETRDIKPTNEIYMALLQSFTQNGDVSGAERIATAMQFAGITANFEYCKLLVQVNAQAGNADEARSNFNHMMETGHVPDDECTASMIAAYEKKNLLDKALNLLLQLEKDGFQPGVATYTVLVDWLGKLQLIDEAEELLGKISQLGEVPPLKIHVSLCDMYSRAKVERKALQALGVLEAKKEELGSEEFQRIINALLAGGFVKHANKMLELMEAQGFTASDDVKVSRIASHALGRRRPPTR